MELIFTLSQCHVALAVTACAGVALATVAILIDRRIRATVRFNRRVAQRFAALQMGAR